MILNTFSRNKLAFFYTFLFSAVLLAWTAPGSCDEVRLQIQKAVSEKMKVAVPDFSSNSSQALSEGLDRLGKDVLENDLLLSGLFDTMSTSGNSGSGQEQPGQVNYERWAGLGAQLLVLGDFEKGESDVSVKFRLFDITARNFLLGKQYQGEKSLYRWMIHRFADEIIGEVTGVKGSSATMIAFTSYFKGNKEVYLIDQDGTNPRKISSNNSITVAPAWSPDGENIAFTSYRNANPNLYITKKSGNGRKMVSNVPGLNDSPAWSPDGEKIAYALSKNDNPDIYLLHKDGTQTRVTSFSGIDTSPAWSPDGQKLAYTSNRNGTPQIYVLDVAEGDKGKVRRISYNGSQNDDPEWSPDGKSIAYTSLRNGHFEIVVEDMEKNVNLQLTITPSGSSENPSWSPDGRFIAFSSSREGKPQIYIMRADGSGVRKLTFLEGGGYEPSWSPRFYR
ncbi:MAG: Tol-Pal system beta propeller repeat protein TolB [Nitrospinae bacterium]|nr:Tol-Pal system beta propeller repeat protein TolB [Nitrospinota bacterium]